MLIIAALVAAVLVVAALQALTAPSVERTLRVAAENRQHMIDNNTADRPFH